MKLLPKAKGLGEVISAQLVELHSSTSFSASWNTSTRWSSSKKDFFSLHQALPLQKLASALKTFRSHSSHYRSLMKLKFFTSLLPRASVPHETLPLQKLASAFTKEPIDLLRAALWQRNLIQNSSIPIAKVIKSFKIYKTLWKNICES